VACWAGEAKAQYGSVGTAAGYLPVGTTTVPASMLGVYGGITIGSSYISTTAPTNGAIIQGNVGIGTTSPSYPLQVNGDIVNSNPSNGWIGLTGDLPGYSNGVYPTLKTNNTLMYISTNGAYTASIGTPTGGVSQFALNGTGNVFLTTSGSSYLNGGNVGIGTTSPNQTLTVSAASSGSDAGGAIGIYSTSGSSSVRNWELASTYDTSGILLFKASSAKGGDPTSGTSVLALQSNGNVGIGTTSPNALGSGGAPTILQIHNPGTGLYTPGSLVLSSNVTSTWGYVGQITFGSGGITGSTKQRMAQIQVNRFNSDPTDPAATMSFLTANGPGTDPAIRMTIDNLGNVGIGTTAPQSKLHVQAGEVQVGSSGASCASANAGAIRYSGGSLYYCDNASTWESIDSSGTSPTGDYYIATQTATATSGQGLFGGSSTLGGILTGYGSTADVTLQNRSGTAALEILANSTNVYMPGNVGIGTTSPSAVQHNYAAHSGVSALRLEGADANPWAIEILDDAYSTNWSNSSGIFQDANGSLNIYGGAASANPSMVITHGGSVGIGTTSPQATLDVNGYARLKLQSSQPVACSSTNQGALALNHLAQMCACNGTSWIFADSVGASCSW
jgi:hypothetical protein